MSVAHGVSTLLDCHNKVTLHAAGVSTAPTRLSAGFAAPAPRNAPSCSAPPRLVCETSVLTTRSLAGLLFSGAASAREVTLLDVSYDPTHELYADFNAAFAKQWKGALPR
jgi:hypothetical protein